MEPSPETLPFSFFISCTVNKIEVLNILKWPFINWLFFISCLFIYFETLVFSRHCLHCLYCSYIKYFCLYFIFFIAYCYIFNFINYFFFKYRGFYCLFNNIFCYVFFYWLLTVERASLSIKQILTIFPHLHAFALMFFLINVLIYSNLFWHVMWSKVRIFLS